MKRLPSDFLSVGRGAEYVFRGEDAVTLVSGGRVLTLTTKLTKETSSLVLAGGTGEDAFENVLFQGSAPAAMQAFLDISSNISKRPRRSILSTIQSLSISAAAIAIVAALSLFVIETRHVSPMIDEMGQPLASLDQLDVPMTGIKEEISAAPVVGSDPTSLKVLKKPDFLASEASSDKTASMAQNTDMGRKPSIADTIAAIGLPLGSDSVLPNPAGLPDVEAKFEATPESTSKVSLSDNAATGTSKVGDKTAANITSAAEPKTQTTSAIGGEAENADPAIGKNAQAAVDKLIGDGMTEDQIRKLLMDLQSLKAGSADGITPEMLKALPEEIATLLADQGMDLDGPDGGTMNILPSEVVDRFRGKDGVASIPENHSWYARAGGPVSIPLPGGGDIKQPDDLKDFGLQP